MKFSINQGELSNALSIVLKGISNRSTLPVLSGILLTAEGDRLVLQTTDLELSIKYSCAALIEEPGSTVVPGKLFADIVRSFPDAAVHFSGDDDQAHITCDTASFSLKVLSAQDFPAFPEVTPDQRIEVPFALFSSMVRRVARVVSKDESRAILTGVLITREEGKLRMVATDSFRLAITETELPDCGPEDFQAVIAGAFLSEIATLPKTESPVSIALAENQIVVTCDDTVFINRRIEGNFPNCKQLLPDSCTTRATFTVEKLLAGVKRVSLLGSATSAIRLNLNNATQTMQISSIQQDVGSAQETVNGLIEGEDIEIGFNYHYVTDGLSAVRGDSVTVEVLNPLKPGIFREEGEESYLYLLMPVRDQ